MKHREKKVASVYALAIEELYEMKDTPCEGHMYAVRRGSFAMCNEDQEDLSFSLPASAVEGLDFHIAQQIWKKASRLLAKKDAIFPEPSKDTSVCHFCVISETSDTPNFVQLASNGKIRCTCKNYRPKKVCLHAIAVAEKENRLNDFVSWYRKQKVQNNLTAVASLNVNIKASGRKKSAPQRHTQARLDVQVVDPLALTSAWVTSTATSITNNQFAKWSAMWNVIQLLVAPAPAPAPASASHKGRRPIHCPIKTRSNYTKHFFLLFLSMRKYNIYANGFIKFQAFSRLFSTRNSTYHAISHIHC